jgi:hypothetical protein
MLIDCEGCKIRGHGCADCVVTLFMETPPAIHQLGDAEAQAIEMFARAGFEVQVLDPTHDSTVLDERPIVPRRWHAA